MTMTKAIPQRAAIFYRTIWRWHFYAGIFCLPFIIVLSISGSIFLFKPEIDRWIDRPFDHMRLNGPARSLDDQIAAARAAYPKARLKGIELTEDSADAARVLLMTQTGEELRVYVRPDTLEIVKTVPERQRFTMIVRALHGELLAGDVGAILVELAGAWAIVMVVTGLYLWWPRGASGLGGILYPRLRQRRFVRDLHAVTGFWISVLALFFLISALPWTKVWGEGFKTVTRIVAPGNPNPDWTTGPSSEHAAHMRELGNAAPSADEMPGMNMGGMDMGGMNMGGVDRGGMETGLPLPRALSIDAVASIARPMNLPDPVIVSEPTEKHPTWTLRSDTPNRTARVTVELSPQTGAIVRQSDFAAKGLIDRIVGIGVSVHEGQLFGWPNQLLGIITAMGYLTLVVSGAILWWRRRPRGMLGAPMALADNIRIAPAMAAIIVLMGIVLPTLGLSLIVVLLTERLILCRIPSARVWLGLGSGASD